VNKKLLVLASLLAVSLSACDKNAATVNSKANDKQSSSQKIVKAPAKVGSYRPEFSLPDQEGVIHKLSEWDGKVLVINFWATWCPPCRKETPAFVKLQEKYGKQGLQFIGVAIDEKDNVENFADTYGVNYPMLLGDLEAINVSKSYGNRFGALPYTVIVDRKGKISYIQPGELLETTAEEKIKALL